MSQEQLDRIRRLQKDPLPTPSIGWPVQWFEKNEETMCAAATVTKVLAPGKVELKISKPRHVAIHRTGVLHRSDPTHEQRAHPATIAAGSWDYLPGMAVPPQHYEMHLEELARLETALLQQMKKEPVVSPDAPRRGRPPKIEAMV